ncbi:hypothetical protein FJU31_09920 [Stenotrophomonas cyclobalanopsidis]|uniref:Uncharacterized protein n=1 Tax=Stenotrophomonas cyclobalanopsidis TaxID=2771362 RepID=A0ABQ6T112_9GAMM|nr:hypothetical protein [Stenotrophomonas cyclobalanopsidis]KAA8998708.1 hypothetical protein FJU31_09920 [Stenotrophomonas cyclobalanopsidis]
MAIFPMARHLDFDHFLKEQNAARSGSGNLTERRNQWLEKIELLYTRVQEILSAYIESGAMKITVFSLELREERLGSYQAPGLSIDLGGSSVRFVPIGTILLGSPGRVDLVGLNGNVRFVLTLPDAEEPMLFGWTSSEEAPSDRYSKPTDLAAYVWKVSTSPPRIRYRRLDAESLQSAIMEVTRGHSIRR